MEKYQSQISAKSSRKATNDDPFRMMPMTMGKQAKTSVKPDRQDVSRCIHIWAKFYRMDESSFEPRELCVPPGPWTPGRS